MDTRAGKTSQCTVRYFTMGIRCEEKTEPSKEDAGDVCTTASRNPGVVTSSFYRKGGMLSSLTGTQRLDFFYTESRSSRFNHHEIHGKRNFSSRSYWTRVALTTFEPIVYIRDGTA